MKSKSTFRAYVTAILAPWIVGIKRILTDSNGYIQKSIDEVNAFSTAAQAAATDADASKTAAAVSATTATNAAADADNDAATVKATSDNLIALYRSFATVWYGAESTDPATDPNGNAPVIGAEYWNTTNSVIRVYTSTGWEDQDAASIADAKNAALSASQASNYASQAQQSATSAATSATSADGSATTSQSILDQMKAMMPSYTASDAGFFFRISDDGTAYTLSSPTTALTAMGGAPLSSPAFTDLPSAPTAAVNTNTNQLATCAYVLNQAGNTLPLADGTAAIGTSLRYARMDHVHPSDPSAVSGTLGTTAAQSDLYGIGLHYDGKSGLMTAGFRPIGNTTDANDMWYNIPNDDNVIHTTGGQIGNGTLLIGSVTAGTSGNLVVDGPLGSSRYITYRVNGNPHWFTGGDSTSLSGNNTGDNFVIGSYDDKGVLLRNNLVFDRQLGGATFASSVTMSNYGKVTTKSGGGSSFYIDKPSNFWGQLVYQTGGSTRWSVAVPGDENGTTGADFYIQSWNGGDAALDTPFRIYRNNGLVYMPRGMKIDSTSNVATQGASNQSAYFTTSLSSRNAAWMSQQYLEEIVGTGIRHVIKVTSSSNNYSYLMDETGTFTANIFSGRATTANYGDLAEYYKTKTSIEKGTVVCISRNDDPDVDIDIAPKGSSMVFGVISTEPGLVLNTKDRECGELVALTGRVPTKVEGPIYKGDPVSMSTKTDGVLAYGTDLCIGFALETNLDADIKIVNIAIGGRCKNV